MNKLVTGLKVADNRALTQNLAESYASTLNSNLDWFGKVGALRGKDEMAKDLFGKAMGENPLDAVKILFYGRDIRGGQGEKSVFQAGMQFLMEHYPEILEKNLHLIPEYGCWKDLWPLLETKFRSKVLKLIKAQWDKDVVSDQPSLLSKWLPSCNTSSKLTRERGEKVRKSLGLSPKQYRKNLSSLRKKLGVVEQKMSEKDFEGINYSHVPSRASMLYSKAFSRRDGERYAKYLEDVKAGKSKINASTLYPYEITKNYLLGYRASKPSNDATLQALWDNLPDYLADKPHNGIVVADVSGSMFGVYSGKSSVRPIDVSVSLALYMSERLRGAFKDTCITFSGNPSFMELKGETLFERCQHIDFSNWAMNTDIQAVFRLILDTAVSNRVSLEDMPDTVYIVSDMAFDRCGQNTNLDSIRNKYEAAGYPLPKLVFWNVNAYADVPITQYDENTALVSGCNPNIFEAVLGGKTPLDVMRNVLDIGRYDEIVV